MIDKFHREKQVFQKHYKVRMNDAPGKVWYLVYEKRMGHVVWDNQFLEEVKEMHDNDCKVIKRLTHRDEITHKELFALDKARKAIE